MKTGWKTAVRYTIGAATIGLVALGGVQASSRSTAPFSRIGHHPIGESVHGETSAAAPRPQADLTHPEGSAESVATRSGDDQPRLQPLSHAPGLDLATPAGQDAGSHHAAPIDANPDDLRPSSLSAGLRTAFTAQSVTTSELATANTSHGGTTPTTARGVAPHSEADAQDRGHPGFGGTALLTGVPGDATTLPSRGLLDGGPSATGEAAEATFHLAASGSASPRSAAEQSTHALNAASPIQSPVPEPETWAMLACGALIVIGATRHRRLQTL